MKNFNQLLSFDNGKVVVFSNGNKKITAPENNYFNIGRWNTTIRSKHIFVGCQRFSIREARELAQQLSLPITKKLYTNGGKTYCNSFIINENETHYISSTGKRFPKFLYTIKQTYNITNSRIRIKNNIVYVSSYSTNLTVDEFANQVKAIVACHKYLFSN